MHTTSADDNGMIRSPALRYVFIWQELILVFIPNARVDLQKILNSLASMNTTTVIVIM